jgi:hypothetical protein
MVTFKIIGAAVVVIVIVLVALILSGFAGKQVPSAPVATVSTQNNSAVSTTALPSSTHPVSTTALPSSTQLYITQSQAEGFIGPVQTSSINVFNTSASISKFSQSLVANASAVWVVIYRGAHNVTISEVVVEAINSSKAQAMYNLMTANVQYHPNYNFGTYDNMSYLEVPYNQTEHQAGLLARQGRYNLFAFVTNESTVNITSLTHVVAGDLTR